MQKIKLFCLSVLKKYHIFVSCSNEYLRAQGAKINLAKNFFERGIFMYYGKVEICGINTAKLPVLTEKEKTELLKLSKNMISEKLQAAINAQINAEMWSAYLYLSMSAYCQDAGLPGMANWYAVQFKEEQDHAMILFNYLQSRGGRVLLEPIAAVDTEWASPLATFEHTLAHEGKVTSLINNLMALAVEEKDFALQSRLNWFVDEQVEEEENATDLVHKLRLIGDNGYGLYQLDQELAARVYTQASPLTSAE